MKHQNKLHMGKGLTDAQKSVVDRILLEEILAKVRFDPSTAVLTS